jgi:sugar lactone lactonase YvrE
MRRIAAACLLIASAGLCEGRAPAEAGFELRDAGFSVPECVVHDTEADVYLVSNINGSPTEKDGNGFVSRVSPGGKVLALRWIEGGKGKVQLDAPKGMALSGGDLFVADISTVRVFDRKTGALKANVPIANSLFLNDICPGEDGSVYVTDTGNPAVYRIARDYSVEVVATGEALGKPNGIIADGGALRIADYGGNRIYRLDEKGMPVDVRVLPNGGLDGILRLEDGSILVSSWEAAAVFRVDGAGNITRLIGGIPSPADIGFDAKRSLVLVPVFEKSEVRAVPLPRG